jgi:hypothetical protein
MYWRNETALSVRADNFPLLERVDVGIVLLLRVVRTVAAVPAWPHLSDVSLCCRSLGAYTVVPHGYKLLWRQLAVACWSAEEQTEGTTCPQLALI